MVSTVRAASMAAAAPMVCPRAPLAEVTEGGRMGVEVADHRGFHAVVERGAGAVGVDVVDVAGGGARLVEGDRGCRPQTRPLRVRGRWVVGVARRAVVGEVGQYAGGAGVGVASAFEDEDAGSLAEDEAIAVLVEGA